MRHKLRSSLLKLHSTYGIHSQEGQLVIGTSVFGRNLLGFQVPAEKKVEIIELITCYLEE